MQNSTSRGQRDRWAVPRLQLSQLAGSSREATRAVHRAGSAGLKPFWSWIWSGRRGNLGPPFAPSPPLLQRPSPQRSAPRTLLIAVGVTLLVVACSYLLPNEWAGTAVGLCFLLATYELVLRGADNDQVRAYGLSFGGLLETEPLDARRIVKDTLVALGWCVGAAIVVFPPFVIGFLFWWQPATSFSWAPLSLLTGDALGQLLAVALPEEAFYRGYLQTSLDAAWPKRWKLFGGYLSPGIIVASLLFALGHLLTEPNLSRLAVFFPSLLFGWLRTRTRGIGASVGFHAMSNLFSAYLGRCFGMWG